MGPVDSTSVLTLNTLDGKANLAITGEYDSLVYEGPFTRCPVFG